MLSTHKKCDLFSFSIVHKEYGVSILVHNPTQVTQPFILYIYHTIFTLFIIIKKIQHFITQIPT